MNKKGHGLMTCPFNITVDDMVIQDHEVHYITDLTSYKSHGEAHFVGLFLRCEQLE